MQINPTSGNQTDACAHGWDRLGVCAVPCRVAGLGYRRDLHTAVRVLGRRCSKFFCALVAAEIQPLIANLAMILSERQDRHGQSPDRFLGDGDDERDRARGITSLAVFIVVGITYPRPIFAAANADARRRRALSIRLEALRQSRRVIWRRPMQPGQGAPAAPHWQACGPSHG
jgi:hypothetical protein